jgi:hypothetical protein
MMPKVSWFVAAHHRHGRIKTSGNLFHFGRNRLPDIRRHVITSGHAQKFTSPDAWRRLWAVSRQELQV